MEDITYGGMTISPDNPDYEKVKAKKAETEAKRERWKESQRKLRGKKQEEPMEEIRRGGYTLNRDAEQPGDKWMMGDKEFGQLQEWKKEVNEKLKKLSDTIHGIQMQLGRITKQLKEQPKKSLNILEDGENKDAT